MHDVHETKKEKKASLNVFERCVELNGINRKVESKIFPDCVAENNLTSAASDCKR